MELAVIIVCINESDFLRQTLPRSRRALPDAKFCFVYANEDAETKAICEALRVHSTVSMPLDTLLLNQAKYNVSAFVRTAQLRMKEMLQKPTWTILTRPQVILDASLATLDYDQLDKTNVYGSFFSPILNHTDLLRFQAEEPTAAEVREHVPTREFLLTHAAKDFPSWSRTATDATEEFLSQFTFQYMLQLKLGHLGELNEDAEGRVSKRWEERHRLSVAPTPQVRIAPVHAGATQQRDEDKKIGGVHPQREEGPKPADFRPAAAAADAKPKPSKLSRMFQAVSLPDAGHMSTARKEVDEQNISQPQKETAPPSAASKFNKSQSRTKINPFKAQLDPVDKGVKN